jgi:hypothetical protein
VTVTGWCATCDHRLSDHGDRAIGGTCSYGRGYPDVCGCEFYREGKKKGRKRKAA